MTQQTTTVTSDEIDDLAQVLDEVLDTCGSDVDRAGLVRALSTRGGALGLALRERFPMTDQQAQEILDDALGNIDSR
jgi:hypothetical protein